MSKKLLLTVLALGLAPTLRAQSTVNLPDETQSTTLSADVAEQARIQVPSTIHFDVTNIGSTTQAPAASVAIDRIVLASAANQLAVSIRANAAAFTAPAVGGSTWSAEDVSWNAASWVRGTGSSGVLSNTVYQPVAVCDADVADCSTTQLAFSLAAKDTVRRSGSHTLNMTWKLESNLL